MIIYNVTTHVANAISNDWLAWMKATHIPEIMQSGCFSKCQLVRLLEVDESEGPTYAAQFYTESTAVYNRYIEKYAPALRQAALDKWGNTTIAFRTLMEIVH